MIIKGATRTIRFIKGLLLCLAVLLASYIGSYYLDHWYMNYQEANSAEQEEIHIENMEDLLYEVQ